MAHASPKVEYVHPQVNGVVEGIEEPRCVRYLRVREHLEEWECVVMISANRCASVSVCVVGYQFHPQIWRAIMGGSLGPSSSVDIANASVSVYL